MVIPKKNYVPDVVPSQLLNLGLSTFKYLLNLAGNLKSSKCIDVKVVLDNGIMLKILLWECWI